MNKLKIIKMIVFLLTFLMMFILCVLINKCILNKNIKPYEIVLNGGKNTKINNFVISNDYGFAITANKVYVIDIKRGIYKGSILISGDK